VNVSPHCHIESYLTGSTVASLVNRAKEMGRTHFAATDLGHLSSTLKAYNLCKPSKDKKVPDYMKRELKFIAGLEFYFKDIHCPFVTGTKADRCKYYTATIYAHNQEAYQAIIKHVSRTDLPTIDIYGEKQQLWNWDVLKDLSTFDTSLVLGGVHCMVAKNHLAGEDDVAAKVYAKVYELFGDDLSVALLVEPWAKKHAQVVKITYADGTYSAMLTTDTVTTDKARNFKAQDLLDRPGHTTLRSYRSGITNNAVDKDIGKIELIKGYFPLPEDATLKVNKYLYNMALETGRLILATDYAFYAESGDRVVQDVVLEGKTKIKASLHMKNTEEVIFYLMTTMQLSSQYAELIIINNGLWAKSFDSFSLKYPIRLASTNGEDPLKKAMQIIRRNGRMRWDDQVYVDRLKMELEVIAKNGVKDLTPYFLPIVEVMDHYKEKRQITSVGRGSAGGSLFCYLLGITNINPITYDLPFSRFFSLTRIKMNKLPDIDTDLPQKVTLVGEDGHGGFLYERWGACVGHISTRQTVRLRSAIKDVDRYVNGRVTREIEKFTEGLPLPPQGVSDQNMIFGYEDDEGKHVTGLIETNDDLQWYAESKPQEWSMVSKALGITRAFGKHACATVLSDIPLTDVIPIRDGYVTQYEAKEVEAAGLIKYDFLTIAQLMDIQVCMELINKKNGDDFGPEYITHNSLKTYIWDLPQEEGVYKSIWGGNTVSLFQINTPGMAGLVQEILPQTFADLSAIQALQRPGPLDYKDPVTGRNMVEEYVMRRKGESQPDIKELFDILPQSYGTIIYQEDLGKVAKQLAGFSDEDAEILRENMAKKKMVELTKARPMFIEGATKKVSLEIAEKIWDQMVTFGRYGFSIIHSYEYTMIMYATMFLRHNYPLEWWAAVLTNADQKEISSVFWPHVKHLVYPPDINLSSEIMAVDYANKKIRSKLGVIKGIGEATIAPIVAGRPYKDIHDFVNKEVAGRSLTHKLTHVGVLDSLYPPMSNLLEKLKAYEDAVEVRAYVERVKKANIEGKTIRAAQPRVGKIPEDYVNLSPFKDAEMRKNVLPSLPIDLNYLGKLYSRVRGADPGRDVVVSPRGYDTPLIDGERLKRIESMSGEKLAKDLYLAATCYVVEMKEFSYPKANPTKRALKIVLDADGYTLTEKVLWPDYNSGELIYDKDLARGKIATVFFRKKAGSAQDMNITHIVVES
jgi:DNA-directed DNA polymerase III PolC